MLTALSIDLGRGRGAVGAKVLSLWTKVVPHDSLQIAPLPSATGGFLLICSNSVIFMSQNVASGIALNSLAMRNVPPNVVLSASSSALSVSLRWRTCSYALSLHLSPCWDLLCPGEQTDTKMLIETCQFTVLGPQAVLLAVQNGLL